MPHGAHSGRRDLLLALAGASLCRPGIGRSEIVVDQDYRLLPRPQPRLVGTGVEVIEFFSYGCEACFQFQPLVTRWVAKQPPDVAFVRVPFSIGRPRWAPLVPAYYALRESGALERLDHALFDAIHKEKIPLFDAGAITAWAARNGIDAETFTRFLHSASVRDQAGRAEQMGRDYGIVGIPTLVVNGQFAVRGPRVRSYDDILRVTGELADRARRATVPSSR